MTLTISRREALKYAAILGAATTAGGRAALAQVKFFRIGTGGTGGTYYPVGGMIANAISTSTLNASAVATNGSVANVNGIVGGSMESGFSQADVNFWAYTGTGLYEGKPKVEELRAIANLYPESVHVMVKKGLGVKSVADLKGKRVSIDEPGSGTLVNAKAILAAYGLTERDIRPEYLKQTQSAEKLKDGSLDAFFQTTGYPQGTIVELATSPGIEHPAAGGRRGRQAARAVQVLRAGRDSRRDLRGRSRDQDPGGRRAMGDVREDRRRPGLRSDQGAVERQDPVDARRRARQGQSDPQGNRARRRRHPAASRRGEVLQGSRPDQVDRRPHVGMREGAAGPAAPVLRRMAVPHGR